MATRAWIIGGCLALVASACAAGSRPSAPVDTLPTADARLGGDVSDAAPEAVGDLTRRSDGDAAACGPASCGNGLCEKACGEGLPWDEEAFCKPDCCACGDGSCQKEPCGEGWEPGLQTCAADCAECGNGSCDPGEGPFACPVDCCGACGDGKCKGGECAEDPDSCPADCGKFACGNGACEPGEDPVHCLEDCEHFACGNNACEPGEDAGGCPEDCTAACGDCVCGGAESYAICPVDCGFCGDGWCVDKCPYIPEDSDSCPLDCCLSDCAGRTCGSDGCGGSCGDCPPGFACASDGTCTGCVPDCEGRVCGDDGCGGSCGQCPTEGWVCLAGGACLCIPHCKGKVCGGDGCGGSCGDCPAGQPCVEGGCACDPDCDSKDCGPDGCGGSCGTCPPNHLCDEGLCTCTGICGGKDCGDDGCGGSCGTCPPGALCSPAGTCLCLPDCTGKDCGDDGCGGSCGTCPATPPMACADGICACAVPCGGQECGADECGGSCGTCGPGEHCSLSGVCVCVPDCTDKMCGDDGCEGSCGGCPPNHACVGTTCVCTPDCAGKECGDDGCGGSCGGCVVPGEYCIDGQCGCEPDCTGKLCGPDGCSGSCGGCPPGMGCVAGGICVDQAAGTCLDGNTISWDGCDNGMIAEFQVNAWTFYHQEDPDVATFPDMGFVVAWASAVQDGDLEGIVARRYDANAAPLGDEILVNTQTEGNQSEPGLETLPDGEFVVVWQGPGGVGTFDVFARFFHADGTAKTPELVMNDWNPAHQAQPSVSRIGPDQIVAVWESCPDPLDPEPDPWDGSGCGVFGRVYDDAGNPDAPAFKINDYVDGGQVGPAIVGLAADRWVAAWEGPDPSNFVTSVFARRGDQNGSLLGPDIRVPVMSTSWQVEPAVAARSSNEFLVAWEGWGADGDATGILVRLIQYNDPLMTPWGDGVVVNSSTVGSQTQAAAAAGADGGFLVVWSGWNPVSMSDEIYGKLVGPDGDASGPELLLNTFGDETQEAPAVAAFADGSFIVVWESSGDQDGHMEGVFAQRLTATGTKIYK